MTVPKSGWKLEYDYTPEHGSDASILGPRNEMIVEEPGCEATWEHLDHIVECVNAHPILTARLESLESALKALHKSFGEVVTEMIHDDPIEWEPYTRAGKLLDMKTCPHCDETHTNLPAHLVNAHGYVKQGTWTQGKA